jgi:hypothetical protein
MHTVVFYNNKGGIGKTTLSVHLALFASARRIRTMVVGLLLIVDCPPAVEVVDEVTGRLAPPSQEPADGQPVHRPAWRGLPCAQCAGELVEARARPHLTHRNFKNN